VLYTEFFTLPSASTIQLNLLGIESAENSPSQHQLSLILAENRFIKSDSLSFSSPKPVQHRDILRRLKERLRILTSSSRAEALKDSSYFSSQPELWLLGS